MGTITKTLGAVFIVQCVLVFLLNVELSSKSNFAVDEPLLNLNFDALESVEITEGEGDSISLVKKEDSWILPELSDFPVSESKWNDMKEKLSTLKRGWPVATTSIAAKQLKLSDEEFEKKLTFKSTNGDKTLLFGTSPGFKKVHAKVSDEAESFSVNFSTHEASTKLSDWTDKDYLKVARDEVRTILHPKVTLKREEKSFTLDEIPEGMEVNKEEVDSTAKLLIGFTFLEVLGTEDKEDYHLENESASFELEMEDGKKVRYDLSLHKDGAYAVLKPSNAPYYFKVTKVNYETVRDLSAEKLLKEKETETKEEGEGQNTATTDPASDSAS